MKRLHVCFAVVAAMLFASISGVHPAAACTGIRIKPQDGAVIVARTLEFGLDLQSNVVVIPRATESTGTAPGDKPGLRWKSRHGIVGANAFGLPIVVDGLNEKGLAVAAFYFPGYAKYQDVKDDEIAKTIAPWELPLYLLANCANVDEAVQAVQTIRVGNVLQKNMGQVPPCHYMIADAGGRYVVLEYAGANPKVHDDPFGVITNAPTFDWHVTNLSNYINLTADSVLRKDVAGVTIRCLGQGSGMLGLPGDFTPPSRFVRAVAFSQSALPVATARDGVLQAFHILNQFDIPKGASRESHDGRQFDDYTLWTSASDLKNLCYYFRTFDNSRIRRIDLNRSHLDAKTINTISMAGPEVIEDLSDKDGPTEKKE